MSETKPRDLTAEQLAQLTNPGEALAQTAPLRVPPGTETAIELLNPAAETTAGSPNAVPGDLVAPASGGASPSATTALHLPKG
jgi:hypothetical protein